MHYTKKLELRPQLIKKVEVLEGRTISMWRSKPGDGEALDRAKVKLEEYAPEGQELFEQHLPRAAQFRETRLPDGRRFASVVDDCETDDVGGYDPQHCGVRVCQDLSFASENDELFGLVRELLNRIIATSDVRGLLASRRSTSGAAASNPG